MTDTRPETIFHVVAEKGNHLIAVEMIRPNGARRLIPGFRDRHEADAWIIQTERLLHSLDPRHRIVPLARNSHARSSRSKAILIA